MHIGILLITLPFTGGAGAVAQSAPADADFSWIALTVGARGSHALGGYDGWTPVPAPFIHVSSPWSTGRAEVGVDARPWTADRPDLPSFTALFVSVGWAFQWRVSNRLEVLSGLRGGNHLMIFRTDQLVGQRVESEFAAQPHAGIRLRAAGRTWITVDAGLLRVFTSPRLDEFSGRAGLSWRFDAPDGLRDLLR